MRYTQIRGGLSITAGHNVKTNLVLLGREYAQVIKRVHDLVLLRHNPQRHRKSFDIARVPTGKYHVGIHPHMGSYIAAYKLGQKGAPGHSGMGVFEDNCLIGVVVGMDKDNELYFQEVWNFINGTA